MSRNKLRYAILLPLMAASGVHAQTTAGGQKPTASSGVLEEIIVTATRRNESVRDIPVSITAFSGDDLVSRGLVDLSQILRYVPGVFLQPGSTPDANQINIRGGSSSTGDFNRPFGLFYGDVPMVNPTFVGTQPEFDPYDMRTVEVLKGPQGTYFGGGALLGAIRYVPNEPSFDGDYGAVSVGYGQTAHTDDINYQTTGMFNIAAGDRFAFRFAGSVRDRAGYIDDSYTGEEDVNGARLTHWRAAAAWKIIDELTATFSYQDRDMKADANTANSIDNDQGDLVNGRRRGGPDGAVSDQNIAQVRFDWQTTEALALSLNISRTEKNGHRYSSAFVTSLAGVDVVNPFDHYEDGTEQFTYELRAVHDTPTQSSLALLSDWTYVAGLYYGQSDQRMHLTTLFNFNNPPPGFPLPTNLLTGEVEALADAKEIALYFDTTRKLSDSFELNLGGRLFQQETPLSLGLRLVGLLADSPVDPEFVRRETLKEDGFNPRAAVTWHATEEISTYLSAAKGYRYGGINLNLYNSPLVPSLFESDHVWNYELGTRTTWLDGRLQADVTAFYIDWQDRQTSQRTPTNPTVEYVANTGAWEIKGVEFGVRAALPYGLSWMVNGAYVNSESEDPYTNDNGVLVPPGTQELTTPEWNASTALTYDGQIGGWDINSAVGYAWRDATDSPLLNAPLDAYGTVDAVFSVGNSNLPMSPVVSLNVTNLTDSDALAAASATAPPGTPGRTFAGQPVWPRTVMLNLTMSFGNR